MRRKHIESALSSIQREFPNPDIELEQYPTSPELAASVIMFAFERGDIGPGKVVLDLGCGTGMLAIGCALVDSDDVVGVDCDSSAIDVATSNARQLDLLDTDDGDDVGRISFLIDQVNDGRSQSDSLFSSSSEKTKQKKQQLQSRNRSGRGGRSGRNRGGGGRGGRGRGDGRASVDGHEKPKSDRPARTPDDDDNHIENYHDGLSLRNKCVDTVITNPPFGTKNNEGIDVKFLRAATRLARTAVYSFHKTSTRPYLIKTIKEKWNMDVQVAAEMKFDIPQTYNFHKQKSVNVEVDLLRIQVSSSTSGSEISTTPPGTP